MIIPYSLNLNQDSNVSSLIAVFSSTEAEINSKINFPVCGDLEKGS